MRGLVVGIVIATSACHPTTQSEIANVCTIVCRCETPLPGEQQLCVAQCEGPGTTNSPDAQIIVIEDAGFSMPVKPAINGISEQCVECVYEHETSCSSLIASCNSLCGQNPEPEPGTP